VFDLTEEDLVRIKERYARMAEQARRKSGMPSEPGPLPDELAE
jgi:hypothetical protein